MYVCTHTYVVQSRVEMDRDRRHLQTQLDSLHRQLAESRDRRDVTAAESKQLAESLSAADQLTAQLREALRHKVDSCSLCLCLPYCG